MEGFEPVIENYLQAGCPNGCGNTFSTPVDVTADYAKCKCGKSFRSAKWLKHHRVEFHSY